MSIFSGQKAMIQTNRLILRDWKENDLELFAQLNADPRVMEHFPSVKSFDESIKEYNSILEHFKKHSYGWWAVSEKNDTDFIGFIGLRYIDFPASFTPSVEIAWRLSYDYWGKGYATEGANACLKYGFEVLKLPEIISFTSVPNVRSQAVMKRIGMDHDLEGDFNHPKLPKEHRLCRHVLYRIGINTWRKMACKA